MTLETKGGRKRKKYSLNSPSPVIMASGIGGVGHYQYEVVMNDKDQIEKDDKPPYRVPAMEEIEAVPLNGLKVISTFTGAGGSCLGFHMVGFRTVWASEFVPAAAEVYRLNFPKTPLDVRDIRKVEPSEILNTCRLDVGEVDVMEGSPPCASFSTAGKREATWGKVVPYSDTRQRVDDLFFEFIRILVGVKPKVFVAENVSGLVKGKAKGYFKEILAAFRSSGYMVKAKLLDAQWLGVPQSRQRLIFMGVRSDLGIAPSFPHPFPYRYSVRDALPYIEARFEEDTGGDWGAGDITDRPAPAVRAAGYGHLYVTLKDGKYHDPDTDHVIGLEGTAIGDEWERLQVGEISDKYFNLRKINPDKPSSTVTQTAKEVGAAGVVHHVQKRKFTIAELKRICSFPDDFRLTGSYSQRWERLGRAVPPLMMRAVAEVIRDEIFARIGE